MIKKILALIISIGVLTFILTSYSLYGYEYLAQNLLYVNILAASIFFLPGLIASTILNGNFFGVKYLLGFLLYPISYLISIYLFNEVGISPVKFYSIFGVIITIVTSILAIFALFKKGDTGKQISENIILFLFGLTIISGFNQLIGLQKDSLLSLDFLQHNAVVMEMKEGNLCLTPNECSNLFQKLGYTSIFHSVQSILTMSIKIPIGEIFVIISQIFTAFSFTIIYRYLSKLKTPWYLNIIASLISIFIFDLGAHSFTYFLPQTMTLMLFMITLQNEKWSPPATIFVIIILILSHFIIGSYLSFLLIAYILFFSPKISIKIPTTITILAILALGIFITANIRGFSIEKVFQADEIDALGFLSNYYFPDNIMAVVKQYGVLLFTTILGSIYILVRREKDSFSLYNIFLFLIGISIYFLAPTYANKFFLGFGAFMGVITLYSIKDLFPKSHYAKILLLEIILISTIPIYLINSQKYFTFYTQGSGKISAIVEEDKELVKFLQANDKYNCLIISDPYTQLMVRSQTNYDTLDGQYQSLKDREVISEFTTLPSEVNFANVEKLTDENICFIYSSRLSLVSKYANPDNAPWRNILYDYEINNNRGLEQKETVKRTLSGMKYDIKYQDSNHILFIR